MPGEMKMEKMLKVITMSLLFTGVLAYECGPYQFTNLVVGGTPVVNPTDWPWIVGLFHKDESITSFQCGATLVSRYLVVTAAHCVHDFSSNFTLHGSEITLVMGRTQVQNWTQQQNVQTRNILGAIHDGVSQKVIQVFTNQVFYQPELMTVNEAMHVIVHPSYIHSDLDGADLAVLELDSPIEVTRRVTPVCMWDESSDRQLTGRNGTVVGWGRDENDATVTETPRKIKLPIVDKQVCLQSNPNFYSIANNFTFCSGNRDGTGPCNGDSGSGMYVLRTTQDGKMSWLLRGVVSRSLERSDQSGICDLSNYIVFTDMSKINLHNVSCTQKYPSAFKSLDMVRLGDKYYYFEKGVHENGSWNGDAELNWRSAQQFCRFHGLQLASVETEREIDLIVEHLGGKGNLPGTISVSWPLWLGGSDSEQEGTWRWTSGQTFNFTDWGEGQPDNSGGDQDCLLMAVGNDGRHYWIDDPCSLSQIFMCELEDVCP